MADSGMVSMELDDEDSLAAPMPFPMPDKPDFPYGLKICLTEKELDKLGLDLSEAEVGGCFHGCFVARITSKNENEDDGGKHCRLEAQIEQLAIPSGDAHSGDT